jgi:Ni,Fe-hydrogenase III large subunit/Ni,Fe-hydrogenase III component G
MNTKEFLQNILGLNIIEERTDFVSTTVAREKFAEVVDELVNARALLDARSESSGGLEGLAGVGFALAHMYATDDRELTSTFGVHALLHDDTTHTWIQVTSSLDGNDPTYPAVTCRVMAAHWYERYMHDMLGIVAIGHPDLRRLVHHENIPEGNYPLRKDFQWNARLEKVDVPYPMQTVEGEGVFQVPVGPIHAGIIEPGHFRFHVAGERIINLEGKLFFTHKGVEKLLEGKTVEAALPFVERISGDAAVSHALAFVQAIEVISDCQVTVRAKFLRTLINELERVTMHIHDLANIGGMGTGYSVIAAQGFRIKERLVNLSDELFGNRFWRDFVVPGGVQRDLTQSELDKISVVISEAVDEITAIVDLALKSDGFRDRIETTGILRKEAALAYGAVGIPARATGIDRDVRRDHAYAAYDQLSITVPLKLTGDVFARFKLRIEELKESKRLIQTICQTTVQGEPVVAYQVKDGHAVGATEGWRGETLHMVYIREGVIWRHSVRDPSFCNWALFGELAPGNIIPDFPLCNKSLNLSYSGTDL